MNFTLPTPLFHIASLALCLGVLVGCQGLQPKNPGELALENNDFLELWESYNSCLTSRDLSRIQHELSTLASAPRPISLDDSPFPVPRFLKNLTTHRSSRLAVDPRAMAASCSIHLAHTARDYDDWNTALLTLKNLLQDYPEPRYAFYTTKAQTELENLSTIQPASLSHRFPQVP